MEKSYEYNLENELKKIIEEVKNKIGDFKEWLEKIKNKKPLDLIEIKYDRKDQFCNLDNLNNSISATRANKEYVSEIEVLTNKDKVKLNSPVHIVNGRLGMR